MVFTSNVTPIITPIVVQQMTIGRLTSIEEEAVVLEGDKLYRIQALSWR